MERASLWADLCALLERHGIAPEQVNVHIGEPTVPVDEDGEAVSGPSFKPVTIHVEGWS